MSGAFWFACGAAVGSWATAGVVVVSIRRAARTARAETAEIVARTREIEAETIALEAENVVKAEELRLLREEYERRHGRGGLS